MPKFAIYTAIVGNYDEVSHPLVVDSRFDYFLFSDTIQEERIGIWQVRPINYTNPDKVKIARYVKTHPETLLPDYVATLWTDANIQIVDTWVYDRVFELFSQGIELASVKHPERDCIYEELFTVCSLQWESLEKTWRWNRVLRQNNYPKHNGLFETGFTYRMHSPSIRMVDEDWWNYIEQYSRRDQLSFNFVIWKYGIICGLYLKENLTVKNCRHFNYIKHQRKENEGKFVEQPQYLKRLFDYYYLKIIDPNNFYNKWQKKLNHSYMLSIVLLYSWRQYIRITDDFKRICRVFIK